MDRINGLINIVLRWLGGYIRMKVWRRIGYGGSPWLVVNDAGQWLFASRSGSVEFSHAPFFNVGSERTINDLHQVQYQELVNLRARSLRMCVYSRYATQLMEFKTLPSPTRSLSALEVWFSVQNTVGREGWQVREEGPRARAWMMTVSAEIRAAQRLLLVLGGYNC